MPVSGLGGARAFPGSSVVERADVAQKLPVGRLVRFQPREPPPGIGVAKGEILVVCLECAT
jgi:hypothetical protein